MKKLLAACATLALLGTALQAGGPVIVEDTAVVAEEPATSAGWVLPAVILAVIGIAVISSDDDSGGNTW